MKHANLSQNTFQKFIFLSLVPLLVNFSCNIFTQVRNTLTNSEFSETEVLTLLMSNQLSVRLLWLAVFAPIFLFLIKKIRLPVLCSLVLAPFLIFFCLFTWYLLPYLKSYPWAVPVYFYVSDAWKLLLPVLVWLLINEMFDLKNAIRFYMLAILSLDIGGLFFYLLISLINTNTIEIIILKQVSFFLNIAILIGAVLTFLFIWSTKPFFQPSLSENKDISLSKYQFISYVGSMVLIFFSPFILHYFSSFFTKIYMKNVFSTGDDYLSALGQFSIIQGSTTLLLMVIGAFIFYYLASWRFLISLLPFIALCGIGISYLDTSGFRNMGLVIFFNAVRSIIFIALQTALIPLTRQQKAQGQLVLLILPLLYTPISSTLLSLLVTTDSIMQTPTRLIYLIMFSIVGVWLIATRVFIKQFEQLTSLTRKP